MVFDRLQAHSIAVTVIHMVLHVAEHWKKICLEYKAYRQTKQTVRWSAPLLFVCHKLRFSRDVGHLSQGVYDDT